MCSLPDSGLVSGTMHISQDIEAEVNMHFAELTKKKSHEQLLTNQLQRLLMCFDIYLETEQSDHALEGPTEFARENIFPRLNR